ncbi:acyl-CoA N-acyltransferase [Serendipita vermifera]|nr:acyl-CoA N-acyltransferase [Serendipita vermifera]
MSEWTTDSNEALHLNLVRAEDDQSVLLENEKILTQTFYPRFTYPIFGEEEKIYGYEGLVINLSLASGSLRQFVSVHAKARLTGTAIDDPENTLYQYLPNDRIMDESTFKKQVEADAVSFRPMGEKIHSYVRRRGDGKLKDKRDRVVRKSNDQETLTEEDENAVVYEVYHANWDTPGFIEFHRRMQIFILLYIEAGSYIQEDEEKWEFVLLFEKRKRKDGQTTYHFVGYTSLYPFYFYPDSTRLRLSQFVILGPYQKQGHGASLYKAVHDFVRRSPQYAELTVEDPSEDFEDLRDKVDLRFLLAHKEFISEAYGKNKESAKANPSEKKESDITTTLDSGGKKETKRVGTRSSGTGMLGPPTKPKWAERWRKELKFAKRQYDRLIEMLILRSLDPNDEASQRAFRLQVKARLKVFNFETLMQLDQEEQYDKLDETFQSVKEGYERILAMLR